MLKEKREKIDETTGKLIALTFDQWLQLGHLNGKYKNPETGKYTMVTPITCAACGEKIPPPQDRRSGKCPKCNRSPWRK